MENQISENNRTDQKGPIILVAVDLSHYSSMVFRKIKPLLSVEPSHIVALHVIDHQFVMRCIKENFGTKNEIKKQLFIAAKTKLHDLLRIEGVNRNIVEMVVCEGTPFIEINKKAIEMNADMIVMGNRGNSGDIESIFFKSTAEKVLRFIKRPVICIPLEGDYKLE